MKKTLSMLALALILLSAGSVATAASPEDNSLTPLRVRIAEAVADFAHWIGIPLPPAANTNSEDQAEDDSEVGPFIDPHG